MVVSILIGILALVAVIVVALLVYRVRGNKKGTHAKSSYGVGTVDTVGVGSSGGQPAHHSVLSSGGDVQKVQRSQSASGLPGEDLRSRFMAMGILSAAIFGSLAAKLWSMQIMQGDTYSKQAAENLYTTVSTPAPRGVIYDAGGIPLAQNRSSYTVLADAEVADNRDVVLRLSALLGIPYEVVRKRILDTSGGAQSQRVVESDANRRSLAYISEHIDAFPGVATEARTTREYPWGCVAAHVLGYVSSVTDVELENIAEGRELQSGDVTGQAGIEAQYDELLSGAHGQRVLVADADGNVERVVSQVDPSKGNDVYLTLRAPVQRVADQAMRDAIVPDGVLGKGKGTGASLVCVDITNGDIVAMSNAPSFAPSVFVGGVTTDTWDSFNTELSHYPLMNRAIAGAYPAASTFKAFTSSAALADGLANADSRWDCTGTWTGFGEEFPQKCWKLTGHGEMDLIHGIAESCDVVFYEIAKAFYDNSSTLGANAMQDYVMRFGFGSITGIDLPGEVEGRIPTPEWKAEYYKDTPSEASWQPGDMSNMVIGQGYVLVTPLQIALGYCGVATGTTIMKPHLLKEVRNSLGETVITAKPEVAAELDLTEENKKLVHEGLKLVPEYFSDVARAFSDFSWTYACKTGTAEVEGKKDYGWFACFAPEDKPRYACACVIEEGSGSGTAAPIVADVLAAALNYDEGALDRSMTAVDADYRADKDALTSTSTESGSRSD